MMVMVTIMTLAGSQADDDDNSWVGADDDGQVDVAKCSCKAMMTMIMMSDLDILYVR